ncbi:MAG: response regulator [Planctomycetes bacterium]|nr:response regulator [Planctomycetota bacterium]
MPLASLDERSSEIAQTPPGSRTPESSSPPDQSARADGAGTPRVLANPRVLVVEDDPTCRRSLARNLKLAGYEVLGAQDGVEALEILQNHGADVVVTDLLMPNMDGVDLILNVVLDRPEIPIIAITGTNAADGRIRAARLFGARSVLAKPFGSNALVEAIAEALER